MGHLWQRFLLTCALVLGLAIGVAATVFGYSNLGTVDVRWSVLQLNGIPLWTVAVVPVVLVLVLGTIYHWLDGLHHFTEHMRHRHRVRELEAEITRLREHLDHVLEMPRGDKTAAAPAMADEPEAPALPAAADAAPSMAELDTAMSAGDVVAAEPASESAPGDESKATEEPKKPSPDKKKRSRIIMEPEPEPAAHTNGVDSEPVTAASKEG